MSKEGCSSIYKVLIVDDEHIIRESLAESIPWQRLGFQVSGTAANGNEALACIKKVVPDIIITDVKMHGMDGIQLCRIVKQQYPDTKNYYS
ncbi:MAG: response regulator [Clostridiaceae bacterium]|nr:response regulator [Clostridiaceae bacterium]